MTDDEITGNMDGDYNSEVAVGIMRVLPLAGIDIIPGGCYQPGMVAHIQIVDVLEKVCYWVPVGRQALNALIGQATHCLEISDSAARILGGEDSVEDAPDQG